MVTDTASLHRQAWARAFDELLTLRGLGPPFGEEEYRRYVDGRPREVGAAAFLGARAIDLPTGSPDDQPGLDSVWALANRKTTYFDGLLESCGPRPFSSSLAVIEGLRARGVAIGLVTASRNCGKVLEVGGMTGLFDATVDGIAAAALHLAGKPDPSTYLQAAARLEVAPAAAVVFEDALAGVRAGRAGGFGLVVGVDRHGAADELRGAGADVVVSDLSEVTLD